MEHLLKTARHLDRRRGNIMNIDIHRNNLILTLFFGWISIAVTGCGGSSDGGNDITPVDDTRIAITSENDKAVANQSMGAAQATKTTNPVTGVQVTDSSAGVSPVKLKHLIADIAAGLDTQQQAVVGIDISDVLCTSGSASFDGNVNTGMGSYSFKNCQFSGITLDGGFKVSGSGDVTGSPFNGYFEYNHFSVDDPSEGKMTVHGRMNISWSTSGELETSNINFTILEAKVSNETINLKDYNEDYTYDNSTDRYTDNWSYTVASTLLAGAVDVDTTQTVEGNEFYKYPDAGQLVITGANNSKVRVTVDAGGVGYASDTVTVETDADGDGTYEDSETVTWSEFDNATL
jgi:hypothetical protein